MDRRITPACAGKSHPSWIGCGRRWDHPRVCGEKSLYLIYICASKGSPPRVRGKVLFGSRFRMDVGITPACAGKRRPASCWTMWCWDHPRVCGEKPCPSTPLPRPLGSPPRVRGKDSNGRNCRNPQRITPACAGKSDRVILILCENKDHPRVCGEK